MAEHDSTIRIKTKFEKKGAEEAQRALKETEKAASKAADGSVKAAADEAEAVNHAAEAYERLKNAKQGAAASGRNESPFDYEKAAKETKKIEASMASWQEKMAGGGSGSQSSDEVQQIKSKTEELQKSIKDLNDDSFSELYISFKRAAEELDLVKMKTELANASANTYKQQVAELSVRMKELEFKGMGAGDAEWDETYVQLQNVIQAEKEYKKELNTRTDAAVQKVREQAAEAGRLAGIKRNAEVSDQRLVNLLAQQASLQQRLNELKNAGVTAGYAEYDDILNRLRSIDDEIKAINGDMDVWSGKARSVASKIGSAIKNGLTKSFNTMQAVARKAGQMAKSVFDRIRGGADGSGLAVGNLTKRLVRMVKQVFFFGVILKSLRAALQGAQEGLKNYAGYSESYSRAMADLKASTETAKNALASAFAPVIEAMIPHLVRLIDVVSSAANSVARFIAIISGKGIYTKAIKQMSQYGETAKEAGKDAKEALAGFDQINTLGAESSGASGSEVVDYGDMFETVDVGKWDFAEQIKEKLSQGDWYGIGSIIGGKLEDALSKIPWDSIHTKARGIGSGIALALMGAMANLDPEALGASIGNFFRTGLVLAMEFIQTFSFGDAAEYLYNTVKSGLDAFFQDPQEIYGSFWKLLYGITDILGSVGLAIAEKFGELLKEVNPEDLKQKIIELGEEIGKYLSEIILAIGPEKLAEVGLAIVNGIIGGLLQIKEEMDKSGVSKQIKDAIWELIKGIDWEGLAELFEPLAPIVAGAIALHLGGALVKLAAAEAGKAIIGSLLEKAGVAIAGAAGGIKELGPKIAEGIKGLGTKIGTGLKGLGTKIASGFSAVAPSIGIGIKAMAAPVSTLPTALAGGGVIAGATTAIATAGGVIAAAYGGWNFGQQIAAAGNEANRAIVENMSFGEQIGEIFKGTGELIGDKLKEWDIIAGESSKEMNERVTKEFEDMKKRVAGDTDSMKTTVGQNMKDMSNGAVNDIGIMKLTIDEGSSAMALNATNRVFEMKANTLSAMNEMQTGSGTSVDTMKANLTTKWDELKNNISTAASDLKTNASAKWNELKDNVAVAAGTLKTNAVTAWIELKDNAADSAKNLLTDVTGIWTNMKTGATSAMNNIRDGITTVWTNIKNTFKNNANAIIGFVEGMVNKVINGINGMINNLNKIKFDLPSIMGGGTVGFNIKTLSTVSLPRLAQGAVIQGGRPFAAILGDQPSGQTNIEAPLATIKQAMSEVLAAASGIQGGDITLKVVLEGREIGRAVTKWQDLQGMRR